MVGCADDLHDSQDTAEFPGEDWCETRVLVGSNACGKSIMWEYVSSVEFGCMSDVNGFVAGDYDRSFWKSVCDHKYGIIRFWRGKSNNEVHGYRSEWCVISVWWDGKKGWFWLVWLVFPWLACGASFNVLFHHWPPKVLCDCPHCVQNSRVSSCHWVMIQWNYPPSSRWSLPWWLVCPCTNRGCLVGLRDRWLPTCSVSPVVAVDECKHIHQSKIGCWCEKRHERVVDWTNNFDRRTVTTELSCSPLS